MASQQPQLFFVASPYIEQPLLDSQSYPPSPIRNGSSHRSKSLPVAPRRRKLVGVAFFARLPALVIAIISAGLGGALIAWLLTHRYNGVGGGIIHMSGVGPALTIRERPKSTTNGSQEVFLLALIISSIATQFISVSLPFVIGVAAYRIALDWISASEGYITGRVRRTNLPTPLQYGLLMDLCNGGGLMSLWRSGSYLGKGRKDRPSAAPVFWKGFVLVAALYTLSHLVGFMDLFLHATSVAISLPSVTNETALNFNYGTYVNQSALAADLSSSGGPIDGTLRALVGIDASQNRSASHRIFTMDNAKQLAYVARPLEDVWSNATFTAPSIGVIAQCTAITPECLPGSMNETGLSYVPSNAHYDCTSTGYPTYRHISNASIADAFSIPPAEYDPSSTTNLGGATLLGKNPFATVYQRVLPAGGTDGYSFADALRHIPSRGTGIGTILISACELSVYDIVLRFEDGEYTLLNHTLSSPHDASFLTIPFSQYYENDPDVYYSTGYTQNLDDKYPIILRLATDIRFSTAPGRAPFDAFVSADVARLALAYSAAYLNQGPVTSIATTGVLVRYALVPLALDLIFIFLYAILCLIVFGSASSARGFVWEEETKRLDPSKVSDEAQLRVVQPLTLVGAMFASDVADVAEGKMDGGRALRRGADMDRLVIGVEDRTLHHRSGYLNVSSVGEKEV